jgi:archaellin
MMEPLIVRDDDVVATPANAVSLAFSDVNRPVVNTVNAKETALAGVATTSSSLTIKGSIIAHGTGIGGATPTIDYLRVKLAAATGVEQILFDPEDIIVTYVDRNNVVQLQAPLPPNGTLAQRIVVAAPIADQNVDIADCLALLMVWCYTNDGNPPDLLLDPGEVNELFIFLDDLPNPLVANTQFTVEIIPQDGAVLKFERRAPLSLSTVMNLD